MTDVPAHTQTGTIHLLRHYPEHEPRAGDPNYPAFEHVRARLKAQGLLRCAVGNEDCSGGIQLHHSHVEFAYLNAVDVIALDYALGLDLTDQDLAAWIESPGNLEPLCLAPESSVLTPSGVRPISTLRVGDMVIGGDGEPHLVTDTMRRPFSGYLAVLDGLRLTGEHPIATRDGWQPAGAVVGAQMRGLILDKLQILQPVVAPVMVDVVDNLARREASAEVQFHDPSVLHDEPAVRVPDQDSAIASSVLLTRPTATVARDGLERRQAALVRAVSNGSRTDAPPQSFEGPAASLADELSRTDTALEGALGRAGHVAKGDRLTHRELRAAHDARLDDPLPSPTPSTRWVPIQGAGWERFIGYVHDISVAGSHSFVAGGLVVHNCQAHHVGILGVHCIPTADWDVVRAHKAGVLPVEVQQSAVKVREP
jgi:hypothetical protein